MTKQISEKMPYPTKSIEVLGAQMAYVDAGQGDPILFLHGNPTSKYLWRNIMPYLENQGRVIALDLIGMGESGKPDIDYTFAEHSEYLDGFIHKLGLQNITLVIHDWGSGLGFDYANRNRDNVKAIAFMEAIVAPTVPVSLEQMPPEVAQFIQSMRSEAGEEMVIKNNWFVEEFLPSQVSRSLTKVEMIAYRTPYPDEKSRKPILAWPREIPLIEYPTDVTARVEAYNKWFLSSELPKLHLYITQGMANPSQVVEFLQAQSVPNYEAISLGAGGHHFLQEDYPHAIGQHLSEWYNRIDNGKEVQSVLETTIR